MWNYNFQALNKIGMSFGNYQVECMPIMQGVLEFFTQGAKKSYGVFTVQRHH